MYKGFMRREPPERDPASLVGMGIGGIGPVVVAGALVGVRGEIINANVALILVIVVLMGAVTGGRAAGVVGAISAALSFDFFHTQPYGSLTINSADDVETTVLLVIVGLVVGEIAVRARRSRVAAEEGRSEISRIHRIAELAARGDDAADVILAVQAELSGLLSLEDCRFEAPPFGRALPELERTGAVNVAVRRYSHGAFELPDDGVVLPVLGRGRVLGRFVLDPTAGVGVSLERRVVAVALADQVGSVLAAQRVS
jgi:hypothetical protein